MAAVDVVLATYNRQDRLPRCLRALAAQRFKDFRLIMVDDGSTPPVREMLPSSLFQQLDMTILRCRNGGPARARNLGLAEATADLVAFIDDDVVAAPGWLEAHVEAQALSSGVLASFGPLAPPKDWNPTPWNHWEAVTVTTQYRALSEGQYPPTWRQFFTGNAVVPRRALVQVGGFDERFTRAEDVELAYRLWRIGATFEFVPQAIGWHYAERSRESWLRMAREYGKFDVLMDELHPEEGHLDRIQRELRQRHIALRLVRAPLGHPLAHQALLPAALAAASVMHRTGLRRPGVRLLSLVYDTEYRRSLRAALKQDVRPGTPGEQPINRASTGCP